MHKEYFLGSALWGWTVDKGTIFSILDKWYEKNPLGFIDIATNYPINKNPSQYGYALNVVDEWLKYNHGALLKLFIKVGSVDNSGSNDVSLSYSSIKTQFYILSDRFEHSLKGVAIHWDQRNKNGVDETTQALIEIANNDVSIGLSGIDFPTAYVKLSEIFLDKLYYQVKDNLIFSKERERVSKILKACKFIAYGINSGGVNLEGRYFNKSSVNVRKLKIKIDNEKIQTLIRNEIPARYNITNYNQLALLHNFSNPNSHGAILGASSLSQLKESLEYIELLNKLGPLDFNKLKY